MIMGMFFVYSIKVALCQIAFFLVYKLLLSRDSFFRFNHYLMLTMIVVSFILPFVGLTFTDSNTLNQGVVEVESIILQGEVIDDFATPYRISLVQVFFIIYIIGVVFMFLSNIVSLFHIFNLISKVDYIREEDGIKIVVVDSKVSPFSWFGYVVMNREDYDMGSKTIVMHEKAHARLGHSYEVMLCNAMIMFQWYNPAAWLMKRELQDIHEYEADAAVLSEGIDAKQYQMLLIRKSVGERAFLLANNLNHNSLKKRIKMMKTTKTNKWQCLKAIVMVPVAASAVVAFACPAVERTTMDIERETESAIESLSVINVTDANAQSKKTVEPQANQNTSDKGRQKSDPQDKQKDNAKVYDVVEKMPSFPGGMPALFEYLCNNVHYPKVAEEKKVEGRVIVTFVVGKDGSISNAELVRSVSEELDAEAIRVVSSMPKWQPGTQNGKPVNVKFTVPVTFKLKGDVSTQNVNKKEQSVDNNVTKVVYIVDGQVAQKEEVEQLSPLTIESISVVKNGELLDKYGAKEADKVVVIQRKKP